MTLYNIGNNIIGGESSDTKPTTYATNTIFYEFDTGAIYEWTGAVWVQRTPGLDIINIFKETINIDKTAELTTDEVLQEWTMADDASSFMRLHNQSTADGEFAPHLHILQDATASLEALGLDVQIGDTLDTGSVPIVRLNLSKDDDTEITTRPLFEISNDDTTLFKVNTTGVSDVTINATDNTITDTSTASGDLFKSNGTKFIRWPKGASLQYLRVNTAADDLEYADPGTLLAGTFLQLDTITAPNAPSGNNRRLYVDDTTPFHLLLKKPDGSTIDIEGIASSSGEANTVTNVGTSGFGLFKQKTGVNFELKTINAGGSSTITVTDDTANDEIDLDVNASNLLLSNLGGTLTVSQLPAAAVRNDQNNNLGDFYLDIGDITVPANPGAGTRRLFVNSVTGELSVRTSAGTTVSLEGAGGGGSGEANTASNIGTAGVGLFDAKVALDLQFKKINAGSTKITITDDTINDEVDIDVAESNLTLSSIGGAVLASQLPAVAVRTDQANTFGDFNQIFANNRLGVNNSAGTFKHIIGSAATADRTVTLPNSAGTIVLDSAVQTLISKTINASLNTLTNIEDSALAAHTSTKITITNKNQLNSDILYRDIDNLLGAHYLEFNEIADPFTPDANKARLYLDDSTGELSIIKDTGSIVSLEAAGTMASIDEITDVVVTSPQDTQVLTWDSATSKWINEFPPAAGGNEVKNDQANTYGIFDQTFKNSTIKIRNPADTFSYTITASAITAAATLLLPAFSGTDILLTSGAASNVTGQKFFNNNALTVRNPSGSRIYTIATSEIALGRTITLPLLTTNDIFVFEAHAQTLTNKTLTAPVISTISNTGTITLPTATTTLVGRDTTDILTNKTINGPDNTITNIQASSLPTTVKQYPFTYLHFTNGTSSTFADGRASPFDRGLWNGKNNASYIILEHDIIITRVEIAAISNSRSGTSTFSVLDDDIAVPNTTVNVPASTNARVSSGAISQSVAAGSQVSFKVDLSSGTGAITYQMEVHGYYNMA